MASDDGSGGDFPRYRPSAPPIVGQENPASGLAPPASFQAVSPPPRAGDLIHGLARPPARNRSVASGPVFDWSESRWGMGDVLLGLPVIAVSVILGVLGSTVVFGRGQGVAAMACFQLSLFGWPLAVSRWKGRGPVADYGASFRWVDLILGPVSAIAMLFIAGITSVLVATAIGLEDVAEASNTQIISDVGPGWARWFLVFSVVVGAPLSEEMYFRGLTLRAIQKRWSIIPAVVGSTILFAGPHFQDGSWRATIVLLTSIGSIGACLGGVAALTRRVGPGIVAHASFNAIATLFALNPQLLEQADASIWPI